MCLQNHNTVMGTQKCRFRTKPPFTEEGGAALPALCNSWLQISYWNSISIEKCFSNKRSILAKSIYFEIQISLHHKESSKLKKKRISQIKSQFFRGGEKKESFSPRMTGNRLEITLITSCCWFPTGLIFLCLYFKVHKKNCGCCIVILIPI